MGLCEGDDTKLLLYDVKGMMLNLYSVCLSVCMSGQIGHNSCEDTSLVWDGLAMEFRIDHNLVDGPATDHLPTSNTRRGNEVPCATRTGCDL